MVSGWDITAKANQSAGTGVQQGEEVGCPGEAHHAGWTPKRGFPFFLFRFTQAAALFAFPVTETLPWEIRSSLTYRLGWSDWEIAVMSEGSEGIFSLFETQVTEIPKGQVTCARTYKKRSDRSIKRIYLAWFSAWTIGERRMLFLWMLTMSCTNGYTGRERLEGNEVYPIAQSVHVQGTTLQIQMNLYEREKPKSWSNDAHPLAQEIFPESTCF